MIGHFPTLYPDELFYSVCARYSERMQYSSKRSVIQELFGTGNVIASIGFPSHLDDFIKALPPGHHITVDYLIDNHTLLPFYEPFLPSERVYSLREDMCGRNGPAIHMRIGIMASYVSPPARLRLCPSCVEEDRRRFGECYWHRVHQVPGVQICPVHKVCVCDSSIHAQNVKTRYEFVAAEGAVQLVPHCELSGLDSEILLKIAHDARWLLSSRGLSQDLTALNVRYREKLSAIGLTSYKGRSNVDALLDSFRNYYPASLLSFLQCELGGGARDNWLLRLVRTPNNAQHPLHHLLLIQFLGYTAETFMALSTERKPFGEGPWPCLNPASGHYQQNEVEDCRIIYSQHVSGRPVGTFSCACGFTYMRTGPDRSAEDRLRLSTIKAFGEVWETRLRMLWEDETVSLRGIARHLRVDPLTVKRHANRIGLLSPRPVGSASRLRKHQLLHSKVIQKPDAVAIEVKRRVWERLMHEHPHFGVRELRAQAPGLYTWLYRNDQIWLKDQTSHRKKSENVQPQRVNWEERDSRLAQEVRAAAEYLKSLPGRPTHLTLSAIGREIGRLALLQQHVHRLPRTARVLEEVLETREAFAVRRVQWVVAQSLQEKIELTEWELVKKAGIERIETVPLVKEATEAGLKVVRESFGKGM